MPHLLVQVKIAGKAAAYLLLLTLALNASGQDLERFLNAVVEVNVAKGPNRAPQFGTGFAVSVNGQTVSILTARHLLFSGKESSPQEIFVTFYLDQPHTYKATLEKDSSNLDLAVLNIANVPQSVSQRIPSFAVRPENDRISIGDTFTAFGGASQSWEAPVVTVSFPRDGDRLDRFRFTGIGIRPGFSGAALLDKNGRLAGVHLGTVEGDESFAHAQKIAYAYEVLTNLGVKMNRLMLGAANARDPYLRVFIFPPTKEKATFRVSGFVEADKPNTAGKSPIPSTSAEVWMDGKLTCQLGQMTFGIMTDYTLCEFAAPTDKPFLSIQAKVFTPTGQYFQFFMAKKYTDGQWYLHSVRLNDIYGIDLREETHQDLYPDALKSMYFSEDQYRSKWVANMSEEQRRQFLALPH